MRVSGRKSFENSSEMIRAGENLRHDLLRSGHPSAGQTLNDPKNNDEAGIAAGRNHQGGDTGNKNPVFPPF